MNKIDWEKIDPNKWTDEDNELVNGPFLEESSFSTLFPKYREQYLTEMWTTVENIYAVHGLKVELNRVKGTMSVMTTAKTKDPYSIIKGRDGLRLLSRGFTVEKAKQVFGDGIDSDIIAIGNHDLSKEKFVKRRQRIIGPNGSTQRALELLTNCSIFVQGKTVSVIGPWRGIKTVRDVVTDCMRNIHPIYNIKELMIKRELAKDESLKNENWERFLPKFKNKSVNKKKAKKKKLEKPKKYTPFPPAQTPRKEDIAMETGEYFLSKEQKEEKKKDKIREKQQEKQVERQKKRDELFNEPEENKIDMKVVSHSHDKQDHTDQRSAKEISASIIDKNKGKGKKKRSNAQIDNFVFSENDNKKTKKSKK